MRARAHIAKCISITVLLKSIKSFPIEFDHSTKIDFKLFGAYNDRIVNFKREKGTQTLNSNPKKKHYHNFLCRTRESEIGSQVFRMPTICGSQLKAFIKCFLIDFFPRSIGH